MVTDHYGLIMLRTGGREELIILKMTKISQSVIHVRSRNDRCPLHDPDSQ